MHQTHDTHRLFLSTSYFTATPTSHAPLIERSRDLLHKMSSAQGHTYTRNPHAHMRRNHEYAKQFFFVTSIHFMISCSLSHSVKPHSRLFSLCRPTNHMILFYSFTTTLQRSRSVFLTDDRFPYHVFSTPHVCSGRSRSYKYEACNSQSL